MTPTLDLTKPLRCYLMGIKGVAMTSLMQLLLDVGSSVRGSDTPEKFVTQPLLEKGIKRGVIFDAGFEYTPTSDQHDVLIYTSAHGGPNNPQVQRAREQGIPTLPHADALGSFFNASKQRVAVSGVGGKSSTSAMIVWILHTLGYKPSFSVGVGSIVGLENTGAWNPKSEIFIAEADEYVSDTSALEKNQPVQPRFWSLSPTIIVQKQFAWDHPDVYPTKAAYKHAFAHFFAGATDDATLIAQESTHTKIADITPSTLRQASYHFASGVGDTDATKTDAPGSATNMTSQSNIAQLLITPNNTPQEGVTRATITDEQRRQHELTLAVPGLFNLDNALSAALACRELGIDLGDALGALATFRSTARRFEFKREHNGVRYYDDYAHHPFELLHSIGAFQEWYPSRRVVIAFQPHTYSRTKELFDEFVRALASAHELIITDIFASAREKIDESIHSMQLVQAIEQHNAANNPTTTQPHSVRHLPGNNELAEFCRQSLKPGDVLVTIGAGDIYKVHDLV